MTEKEIEEIKKMIHEDVLESMRFSVLNCEPEIRVIVRDEVEKSKK